MTYLTARNKKVRLPRDQTGVAVDMVLPYTDLLTHVVTVSTTASSGNVRLLEKRGKPQIVKIASVGRASYVRFTDDVDFSSATATWVDATRVFTQTGLFADYVFEAGDLLKGISGTGTAGTIVTTDIAILSKVDDNSIVLAADLFTSNGNSVAGNIVATIKKKSPVIPTVGNPGIGFYTPSGGSRIISLDGNVTSFHVKGANAATGSVYITVFGDSAGTLS